MSDTRSGSDAARSLATAAGLAGLLLTTGSAAKPAWAWGHTGHVEISLLAAQHLPAELPGFVRGGAAAKEIGELGPEADESKTTGVVTGVQDGRILTARTVHDAERDPGHYVDVDDEGIIQGGAVPLNSLPETREAYDTAQRQAAKPGGQTQYTAGYLPYAIIDGFQQVRKDFGIWRAMRKGLQTASSASDRAYFRYHLQLREELTVRDIGYWSHFVGDGSQPLHVSVHFNGWGDFPNPKGYTTEPIHAPFEGAFVRSFVDFRQVAARIPAYRGCGCTIEQRVPQYLARTLGRVEAVYQAAEKNLFTKPTTQSLGVATERLAAGAAELRDEIVDAWRQSTDITVGFPLVRVSDVLAGKVKVTPDTFGAD